VVVVVLLQILPWFHVVLNHAAQRNHLHPSVGLSDHRVATTGRPHPQGLSDYVAQLFKRHEDKYSDGDMSFNRYF